MKRLHIITKAYIALYLVRYKHTVCNWTPASKRLCVSNCVRELCTLSMIIE